MATPSSIPAWEIPWTEESGWVPSMWSQSVRHDCCDLASIHAQFVNVCFTINTKIHLSLKKKKKGGLKMFLPKDLLLREGFYLKCLHVCICVCRHKPNVYINAIIISWIFLFILTFENCSDIFSIALDCFLVKWIYSSILIYLCMKMFIWFDQLFFL